MEVISLIVWACFWGAIGAAVASSKGRSSGRGFLLCFFFGPIGVLYLAFSKGRKSGKTSVPLAQRLVSEKPVSHDAHHQQTSMQSTPIRSNQQQTIRQTCPFCLVIVKPGEALVKCSACNTAHHEACWRQNSGCTTLNCHGTPISFSAPPPSETVAAPTPSVSAPATGTASPPVIRSRRAPAARKVAPPVGPLGVRQSHTLGFLLCSLLLCVVGTVALLYSEKMGKEEVLTAGFRLMRLTPAGEVAQGIAGVCFVFAGLFFCFHSALWLRVLYGVWKVAQLSPLEGKTTPARAVGFLFIPLFNLYWAWRAIVGVTKHLQAVEKQLCGGQSSVTAGPAVFSVVCGYLSLLGIVALYSFLPGAIAAWGMFGQWDKATRAIAAALKKKSQSGANGSGPISLRTA